MLVDLSGYSLLIPIIIGFINYRKHHKVPRVVTFFVLISGIYELISRNLAAAGIENLKLISPWVIIESVFVCAIFVTVLRGVWRSIVRYLLIAIIILGGLEIVIWGDTDTYSSLLRSTECAVFIVLSLVYFYQLLESLTVPSLSREPMFWFNTAFLIYFAGNLFFFVASGTMGPTENFGEEEFQILLRLYAIHAVVMIFRNLLLATGLWIREEK